jgi:hypothetical protein
MIIRSTTSPIRIYQIVPQGGEWTQDISTSPTRPPAQRARARVLLTDVEVLFILDLVVRKGREKGEGWNDVVGLGKLFLSRRLPFWEPHYYGRSGRRPSGQGPATAVSTDSVSWGKR